VYPQITLVIDSFLDGLATAMTPNDITTVAQLTSGAVQSAAAPLVSLGNGWSIVQWPGWSATGASLDVQTTPFQQPSGAGHLLVAYCFSGNLNQNFTLTDNAPGGGNTWVPSALGRISSGGVGSFQIFYVLNSKAGTTTLTVNGSQSQVWMGCGVAEFVNSAGVSPGPEPGSGFMQGNDALTGTTTSANQVVSVSITTTVNGDLIFEKIHSALDGRSVGGSGFTSWEDAPYVFGAATTQSTAGVFPVTASILSSGANYCIEGIAFKHP
jgi:hypothetical protein